MFMALNDRYPKYKQHALSEPFSEIRSARRQAQRQCQRDLGNIVEKPVVVVGGGCNLGADSAPGKNLSIAAVGN